jgi:phosphatidylserine/phosphatidylglycerophosphate/cardiolipin synthase-like enzyme
VEVWQLYSADVPPVAAAMCLLGAVQAVERHHAAGAPELVWTGPDVGVIPVRRTEQALLQLLDWSQERVTVVSFAVYHIPTVCEALLRAADRGCTIRIILETPDGQEGKAAYDTIAALGPTVRERAEIYVWPMEARPVDPRGRRGLMHVKAVIADGQRLLLSSANLTVHAFSSNMELGVLITGGHLPSDAEKHFDQLVQMRVLVPVARR